MLRSQGLGKSVRLPGLDRPALELGSRGIDSFFLGVKKNGEKKSGERKLLSDTACEETLGDDRELSQENEGEAGRQTKVCFRSDFHIVCVCVPFFFPSHVRACAARSPNLQYHSACEPHTVSKGCDLHFFFFLRTYRSGNK